MFALQNYWLRQFLAPSQRGLWELVKNLFVRRPNQFLGLSKIPSLRSNKSRHTISEFIFGKSVKFCSQPIAFHSCEMRSSRPKMNKHCFQKLRLTHFVQTNFLGLSKIPSLLSNKKQTHNFWAHIRKEHKISCLTNCF